jgi:hypothetical protein
MADQAPGNTSVQIGERGDFGLSFLHTIFAKIDEAGGNSGANNVRWMRFCDADQTHLAGGTTDALRRRRNTILRLRQTLV